MERQKHINRHVELHHALDELVADFIRYTDKTLSHTTLMDLMIWSCEQTTNPTEEVSDDVSTT